ncbi:MAG: helix-turn-helix transcriptional regulator [Acidiphilium sp.]
MRKASRLFEIIQILRLAGKPVTAAKIAGELEVTPRSIYRDIAALQSMRVPIEGGRGIGYILRPGFDLPPLMFSIEETEAIVLALALLERTAMSRSRMPRSRCARRSRPPSRRRFAGRWMPTSFMPGARRRRPLRGSTSLWCAARSATSRS